MALPSWYRKGSRWIGTPIDQLNQRKGIVVGDGDQLNIETKVSPLCDLGVCSVNRTAWTPSLPVASGIATLMLVRRRFLSPLCYAFACNPCV